MIIFQQFQQEVKVKSYCIRQRLGDICEGFWLSVTNIDEFCNVNGFDEMTVDFMCDYSGLM